MRRLARHLFTLCSAVSLLLCVAVCVLWVRTAGFNRFDDFEYVSPTDIGGVWFARGRLYVHRMSADVPWWTSLPRGWTYTASSGEYAEPAVNPRLGDGALGFGFARLRGTSAGASYVQTWIAVPFWAITVATAASPALRLAGRVRSRRRARVGLCPVCAYDLRATPGRCPECGAPAPSPKPATV